MDTATDFAAIINNVHFQRIVIILRTVHGRASLQQKLPFWDMFKACQIAIQTGNKDEIIATFTDLLRGIANAEERLRYSEGDLLWFIRTLDEKKYQTPLLLVLTFATTPALGPEAWITTAQAAAVTDTAESTWRYRANTGAVLGAVRKGKTWLLPRFILIAEGWMTEEQAAQLANPQAYVDGHFETFDT